VIKTHPMSQIQALKTPNRIPHFVQADHMVKLLDNQEIPETFEALRDRLILEVLYGTGIRLSELINLRDDNIDLRQRTIRVLGKRNKERVIPFPASLVSLIEQYRLIRNREVSRISETLFVRKNGEPCYPSLVYKVVRKQLATLPALEKRSPHVLRHTYATHLLDRGAELNAVKDLLGHTSLAATQVYTHNSLDKLRKVFEQAHPKA
jgi:integrase/recombinase XerC